MGSGLSKLSGVVIDNLVEHILGLTNKNKSKTHKHHPPQTPHVIHVSALLMGAAVLSVCRMMC